MSELNESQAVSEQLIQQHGLDSVADLQVEAHGNIYSVRDALTECPPFAKFVTGLATSIEFLPPEQAKEVMTQAVRNMAIQAPDDTETKKKLTNVFQSSTPRTNLI